ncbi:hypothetical protein FOPE_10405 [Fonsecaea pedrosoi]|nr:hypothetical protein FOPE_10405 [Fonsecaea pedrosoi]
MAGTVPSSPRLNSRKKRSHMACEQCHHRKVRCSIGQTGQPCTNCGLDGVACKPYTRARTRVSAHRTHNHSSHTTNPAPEPVPIVAQTPATLDAVPTVATENPAREVNSTTAEQFSRSRLEQSNNTADWELETALQRTDPGSAFNATLDEAVHNDNVPFYVGEEQGLCFVLDICRPNRPKGPQFSIAPAQAKEISPADLAYLQEREVFSLPSEVLCEELIRCYFHHVHLFLPIIDAKSFLYNYSQNGPSKLSPLLLWSMFFVGATFLSDETVKATGFATKGAMRRAMYQKAKTLRTAQARATGLALRSLFVTQLAFIVNQERSSPVAKPACGVESGGAASIEKHGSALRTEDR